MRALRASEKVNNGHSVEDPSVGVRSNAIGKSPVTSLEEKEQAFDRILDQIHRQASRASKKTMARTLKELLSTQLTAYIIGQSEKTINRWAGEETNVLERIRSIHTLRRLVTLYEIVLLINYFEEADVAKTWLLGMNPRLDDLMPAEAIRNGQLQEAIIAARSFVAGG